MQTKLLINGEFVEGDGDSLSVINHATSGEIIKITQASTDQLDAAVKSSKQAFNLWSCTTPGAMAAHS